MSTLEWYEDLLSKTSDSDFDFKSIPETDVFKLKVHTGDTVFAEWDLTDELKETGLAFKNYTNASQNINAEFFFMHQDLVDKFQEDKFLQSILEKILNTSLEHKYWNTSTKVAVGDADDLLTYTYGILGFGSVALILGCVGLFVKIKSAPQAMVVKLTRISSSVICILTGILSIFAELMAMKGLIKDRHISVASTVAVSAAHVILKAMFISWKLFTVIIYVFQNLMLYRPFFFREHKKALGRWFFRVSIAQMVTIVVGFLVWAIILILVTSDLCDNIIDSSGTWNITLLVVASAGYSGSLVSSLVFVIGYYRQSVKKLGQSEARSTKKTLISCSVEILFDLIVSVAYWTSFADCLSFEPHNFLKFSLVYQPEGHSKCDERFRWWALNSGILPCTTYIFLSQPLIQEAFFVLSELVVLVKKKYLSS